MQEILPVWKFLWMKGIGVGMVHNGGRRMHKGLVKEGFTLVELSLSIAFIAVLSIAVTLIVTNAISAYHRGLVLNQLNTVGMELTDDMRAAVQNAPVRSVKSMCSTVYNLKSNGDKSSDEDNCQKDDGEKFVLVRRKAKVSRNGKSIGTVPVFGAFCTGSYSYIWNSGYFFDKSEYTVSGVSSAKLVYKDTENKKQTIDKDGNGNPFRLLKVLDKDRSVCESAVVKSGNYKDGVIGNEFNTFDYGITEETPVSMMAKDSLLVLYDLNVVAPATNGLINNMFYAGSFILGTIHGGVNVMAQGNYCVAPEDEANAAVEGFDYCAINKFNFAARAAGGGE